MIISGRPWLSLGLGLLVGAVLHTPLRGQQVVMPPDSAVQDSARARALADSIARVDTLRHPIPKYHPPEVYQSEYVWRGDEVLASGAASLAELIARVPGATVFRGGYSLSPTTVAYNGCFSCIRVFLDGAEVTPLNPRGGGVLDHSELALWKFEEVRVVRGATEIRVYLSTWSVAKTIPFTRVDIATGSDDASLFGAYFGRRFRGGEVLQLAGQQFSFDSRLGAGSGDRSSFTARVGKVVERWGVDAYASRVSLFREEESRGSELAPSPPFEGARTVGYVRGRFGDLEGGPWLQLMAVTQSVKENTPGTGAVADPGSTVDAAADSARSESQYVVAAGTSIGDARVHGTVRLRSSLGERSQQFALGGSFASASASAAASLSHETRDSLSRGDLTAEFFPLPSIRLGVGAGASRRQLSDAEDLGLHAFAEVGTRLADSWWHLGVALRDSAELAPPVIFDESLTLQRADEARGAYLRVNGRIWRSVHLNAKVMRWEDAGWYRPKLESSVAAYVQTSLLQHFPNNTFNLFLGISYDGRGETLFPGPEGTPQSVPSRAVWSAHLEIRILTATLFFQNQNIRGKEVSDVPGYQLPRRLNVYGVRWSFWN